MSGALLEIRGVKKGYRLRSGPFSVSRETLSAVDGVDLDIFPDEALGLVGESGCGKSTLTRLILLLEKPDTGGIIFDKRDLLRADRGGLKAMRSNMQTVFQDPFGSLNPRKRIISIVEEPLYIQGGPGRREIRERALGLMDMVGLDAEMAQRYPHEFSGGQRQRICIARALMLRPKLLICDEPVSALDVSIQAQIINLLLDLKDEFGFSLLFISHDLSVVGYISDRIAVMYKGRIVEIAGSEELFENPLHPYTRILLGAGVGIEKGNSLSVPGKPVMPPAGCAFSPVCPHDRKECREQTPVLMEVKEGHLVACLNF
ncbi:MAG: oligopeptide/dipeptide ABC transporter ATP-binding protein [Thermodesulfobacteriota bacterium]|nr:oligopeptide/dipeptide ABC transporter ATP-binding protein [Thermodesulfobacteriota bacterium]